jgi:dTDP-4-amino-4,6-dideoxygalactose transaminase
MKIPMSAPDVSQAEIDAVVGVLRTPHLSMGPQIEAFEKDMARLAGVPYAVGINSGTAGLHLAVLVAGLGEGDLAVTSPFSFVASANCLLYERAVPVFVDVDERTGNIDPHRVEEVVTAIRRGRTGARSFLPRNLRRKTLRPSQLRALLPVDVFGQPADMDVLTGIARKNKLAVIEDACEALGSTYKGRPAGGLGDVGVFAYYPNKQMTTGEGGALVTPRQEWADMARSLRNQGRAAGATWLEHIRLGYNYRLDELSAALGVAQAKRLDDLIDRRNRVAQWYSQRLSGLERVLPPHLAETTTRISWFVYVVRILPPADRLEVSRRLLAREIPTRNYFSPIHLQPFYSERFGYRRGDFPVTERLGDQSLALPFSSVMSEEQVDTVCRELKAAVGEA